VFDRKHGGAHNNCFSSINLRDELYQIRLAEKDREETTFCTAFGWYENTVLPMGLCNVPSTFMQLYCKLSKCEFMRPEVSFVGLGAVMPS
jgi:hypothetical protein